MLDGDKTIEKSMYNRLAEIKTLPYYLEKAGLILSEPEKKATSIQSILPLGQHTETEIVSALIRVLKLPTIPHKTWLQHDGVEIVELPDRQGTALLLYDKTACWLLVNDHRLLKGACDFILKKAGPIQLTLVTQNQFESSRQEAAIFSEHTLANKHWVLDSRDLSIPVLAHRLVLRLQENAASDLHIMPDETGFKIGARVNGLFERVAEFTFEVGRALINYWKVSAKMDITQQQKPQDGVILADHKSLASLRISTCPTLYGEKMVLRLHARSACGLSLDELGLSVGQITKVRSALDLPQGLILFIGPTGSGKTRSLYAALQHLTQQSLHCISIEDPIEIHMEHVTQVPVTEDFTFACALRTILRQDPDVVVIGEIRDGETAKMAVSAAQTGHLVLATIHAESAAGSLARLSELGVGSDICLPHMNLLVTQRLLRLLRPDCAINHPCDSRYLGRTGIFEVSFPGEVAKKVKNAAGTFASTIATLIKNKKTDWHEVTRVFGKKATSHIQERTDADDLSSN